MKRLSIAIASACGLCALTSPIFAKPQDANVTVTVIADDSGEQTVSVQDDPKSEKGDEQAPKKGLKLQLRKQPTVIVKRMTLSQDGARNGDEAGDDKQTEVKLSVTIDGPPKIWLGVGLKEVSGDLATYLNSSEGVFVEEVFPESPAEAAKLQKGDIITALDGEALKSPTDLVKVLRKISQDAQAKQAEVAEAEGNKEADNKEEEKGKDAKVSFAPVKLTIKRHEKEITVELTPGARPEAFSASAQPNEPSNILILGTPKVQSISRSIFAMNDKEGRYQVQIEKQENGQAKITVTDDKGERVVDQDELKQLPEKLRAAVESALKHAKTSQAHAELHAHAPDTSGIDESVLKDVNEQVEKALKQMGTQIEASSLDVSKLTEQLKKMGQSHGVVIVGPEAAMKWAEAGAGQARAFLAVPQEIATLHEQIDQLKKEVDELKAELKASKK